MTPAEITKLQAVLTRMLRTRGKVELRKRGKLTDSVEVYIDNDFVGVLSEDDEDGDRSFALNISILEFDLDDKGA